jgi:hypothetical protein
MWVTLTSDFHNQSHCNQCDQKQKSPFLSHHFGSIGQIEFVSVMEMEVVSLVVSLDCRVIMESMKQLINCEAVDLALNMDGFLSHFLRFASVPLGSYIDLYSRKSGKLWQIT